MKASTGLRCCCGIQSAALRSVGCAGEAVEQSAPRTPSRTCSRNPQSRPSLLRRSGVRRRVVGGRASRRRRAVGASYPSRTCSHSRPSLFRRSRRCAPSVVVPSAVQADAVEQSAPSSRAHHAIPSHARHCSAVLAGVCRRVVGTVSRAL